MNERPAFENRLVTSISELTPVDAFFAEGPANTIWNNHSGLPASRLEQVVRKPRLSRLRAAWNGVAQAGDAPIISHLPRMTAAVALMQSLRGNNSPHLAFSFNFTDLPEGAARALLTRAFARVDRFCVFSRYEACLYPDYFGIDPAKMVQVLWAQDAPNVADEPSPFAPGTYVSAVGGEGRDYDTLLKAAKALPSMRFVIIARPHNLTGELPPNVKVMTNLPASQTWRIARDSLLMVVPLRTAETCCGHITLVGGEQLGIPIVTSTSAATKEYTEDCLLYAPGNVDELIAALKSGISHAEMLRSEAVARIPLKLQKYARGNWEQPVADFLTEACKRPRQ